MKVLSVTSGKGGVGKTIASLHMALSAQAAGKKVLLVDGDMGLANVDVVLGLTVKKNIADVLQGQASFAEIIVEGPEGLKIIPGASGMAQLANLSYAERITLLEELGQLQDCFDLMVLDTGAGISDTVLQFNEAADVNIVITTTEPHAMTDAYAMIKLLMAQAKKKHVYLIVNQVQSPQEGEIVFRKLSYVTQEFLDEELRLLGFVPMDPVLKHRVSLRQAGRHFAHTIAGQAFNRVTQKALQIMEEMHACLRQQDDVWRELVWTQQAQKTKVPSMW